MNEFISEDTLDKIKEGISVIKDGGLVAYPTDTVYGLGACFNNIRAVEKIFKVKNRTAGMPLPLLLADISWMRKVTENISDTAVRLVNVFMPGALTLIMRKSRIVPDIVSGGKDSVAVRIPGHPVTLKLIEGAGLPVTGTSANISGKSSPLTATEVKNQLGDSVDYILDGGKCPGGIESTILDLTGEIPVMIREGAIPKQEIEKYCRVIMPDEED